MESKETIRKMQSYRLKPETITLLDKLCSDVNKMSNIRISKGEIIDILVFRATTNKKLKITTEDLKEYFLK